MDRKIIGIAISAYFRAGSNDCVLPVSLRRGGSDRGPGLIGISIDPYRVKPDLLLSDNSKEATVWDF